jgi:diacylglycerol kinase (ATP)
MERIVNATLNSGRAFRHLARHEAAFRQEMMLLCVALPLGWLIAPGWRGYALLIASLLVLIIVEVINTAIEQTCNAITREPNPSIRLAKDCGSLAVAFALVLAGGVWALALLEWATGLIL